jgi:hypothetical protein
MDANLAYLLELRVRTRGSPRARAIVDRCLALIALAETADEAGRAELYREVADLADHLALRFGAPSNASVQ